MGKTPQQQSNLVGIDFDPIVEFKSALRAGTKWDSIVDFATHPSFCGQKLYPRQLTLLKLIYLETEHMTAFDLEVIEEWRQGFKRKKDMYGVQPDIWDRVNYLKDLGFRHFPHIEAVIGRRGSKGVIGGILGAEKMAYFYSLDNWQDYYGIKPGKDGYMTVVATNSIQAKKFQFADIRDVIENCEYLKPHLATNKDDKLAIRTPADLRRLARMKADRIPIEREIASLHVVAMSSNSSSGRGATGFANFYDEFAHMITGTGGTRSSEEVYEAYQPSLDQFGQDSLTYIPSSPYTQVGKMFELYKAGCVTMRVYNEREGIVESITQTEKTLDVDAEEELLDLTADPEMLVVQLPSWELYRDWERSPELGGHKFKGPIQVLNTKMLRIKRRNPEKFKVEREAQFASVIDAYLDPEKVDEMFAQPLWDGRILGPQDHGKLKYGYRIHVDPGLTNANFALTIAHLEDAPPDEFGDVWPHVIIDYMKVWKPGDYKDHTVPYPQIQKEIAELLRRFPSTIKLSFDQWNSAGMIAALREEFFPRIAIEVQEFTLKTNRDRCENFKSAMNLGWVHAYRDDFFVENEDGLLSNELKFLQEKNGQVVKQDFGPVTTKDLADTVMEVTVSLLHRQLDQWQRKVMGSGVTVGQTNVDRLRGELAGGLGQSMAGDRSANSARRQIAQNSLDRRRGFGGSVGRTRGRGR